MLREPVGAEALGLLSVLAYNQFLAGRHGDALALYEFLRLLSPGDIRWDAGCAICRVNMGDGDGVKRDLARMSDHDPTTESEAVMARLHRRAAFLNGEEDRENS